VPIPDPSVERARQRIVLTGDLPSPADPPSGCRFHTRCHVRATLAPDVSARCVRERPVLSARGPGAVACHAPLA
jgi:peptide/nickel transport system ATP-binding protein